MYSRGCEGFSFCGQRIIVAALIVISLAGTVSAAGGDGELGFVKQCYGVLSVTSTPSGAAVFIDGVNKGSTPLSGYRISMGPHTLRVNAPMHVDATETLTVSCDQTYTKQYTLAPIITTTPVPEYQPPVAVQQQDPVKADLCIVSGKARCGQNCIDLMTDHENCGSCGLKCPIGSECRTGVCGASNVVAATDKCTMEAKTSCNGVCKNLTTDVSNCGACGNVCDYGFKCIQGECSMGCAAGLEECGYDCVDLKTDSGNCGTCGNSCGPGKTCCSGKCVDLQTDILHCGSCNSQPCILAGTSCCNGKCVNLQTDLLNCGSCNSQPCILQGTTCCNGQCMNVSSDPNRCGSCNNKCGQCQICDNMQCTNPSADVPRQTGCELYQKLLFVPLNWEGDQKSFDDAVDAQVAKYSSSIPLVECPFRIGVRKLDVMTQNNRDFTCSQASCGPANVQNFVQGLGINPADYTYVIGLAQRSPCPPMSGCSNRQTTVWVEDNADDRSVTAHEIGHILGLRDEYCSLPARSQDCRCNDGDSGTGLTDSCIDELFEDQKSFEECRSKQYINFCTGDEGGDGPASGNPNWLDANLGCDPYGISDSCCTGCLGLGYDQCCDGNKNNLGGRCIMGPSGSATNTREFCRHCSDWLNGIDAIHCHSPKLPLNQSIVDVSLSIHPDNTITNERIILTDGIPTMNYQPGTGYELRTISGEKVIWNTTMNIYFDYYGPVERGADYSGIKFNSFDLNFRIPYNESMKKLEVFHNKTLIFSEDLNFCNNDRVCTSPETFQTCPGDCPLDKKDKVCIAVNDSVCDPDCLPGVDHDCSKAGAPQLPALFAAGGIAILILAIAGFWIVHRKGTNEK